MRNVMIVLACVVVCGVVGFMGTALVVRQDQVAARTATADGLGGFGRASGDLAARQRKAMIGGGVGLGCGLVLGIGMAGRGGRGDGALSGA